MNIYSGDSVAVKEAADTRPILIIPYMWIGDFVRGHSLVRLLNQRWPNRPVDLLTTTLCAPLIDYMPGVRAGIVWDLPRSRLALAKQRALAEELRARALPLIAQDSTRILDHITSGPDLPLNDRLIRRFFGEE